MDSLPPRDILTVRGVAAGYGGQRIVADIDFVLRPGDILGLLGANGSGKSTLLKAITGQIRLLTGHVAIDGIDLLRSPELAKARLGLAIDGPDLPAALSGRQYLELVASIRSCAADEWPCGDLLARLALSKWLDRPIAEYSLGTQAKISIAAALLGSPPLLIFDESLNGLDPVASWEVKRIMQELAANGRHAIILSTHVVETVPGLCNRAMFLAGGGVIRSWNSQELVQADNAPGGFEVCIIQALTSANESMAGYRD